MIKLSEDTEANNIRRQDVEESYYLNGTFYSSKVSDYILDSNFCSDTTIGVETSYLGDLEIDNSADLEMARAIFKYKQLDIETWMQ